MWNIYHDEIPEFLMEFIEIDIMKRIENVGMNCGCEYTSFSQFQHLLDYSRYVHSVGCALIIWHFTKDVKQTLSGLFHDVSAPAFSHVIDFLHHDHMNQESTEEKTLEIMKKSKELVNLLEKHGISLDEISDYHMYPIADNNTPQLSADRLEYTLSNLYNYGFCTLDEISAYYHDLVVDVNEHNEQELCFQSEQIACEFALNAMKMARIYVADADRYAMQVLSDVIENAVLWNILSESDLYQDENHVISRLLSDDRSSLMWKSFTSLCKVYRLENRPETGLWRKVYAKRRWINPRAVSNRRVLDFSSEFKQEIHAFMHQNDDVWIGNYQEFPYL